MLKECLAVFEKEMSDKKGKLVLDSHVPADGTYLIVDAQGKIKANVELERDKRTKDLIVSSSEYLPAIRFFDYHSLLVSMNKPVDPKKVIHSNNYLAFAVKKESILAGKVTEEIIDNYYNILENPLERKYTKSLGASEIYKAFEEMEGCPDQEKIRKNKTWIKENLEHLKDIVDFEKKNYLKIYFEDEEELYIRENSRYLLPNIYNSNDYNVKKEDKIYGIPDNNLGMNAKKPFLAQKTRKIPAPYLIDRDEVLLQKEFFDYLMNLVSQGKYNIYIDTDRNIIQGYKTGDSPKKIITGYYLRIAKGKNEAEILDQDNISEYKQDLKCPFYFENILERHTDLSKIYEEKYQAYYSRLTVGQLIDEVVFSKWLGTNYTVEPDKIGIKDEELKRTVLESREIIFNWVFKGIDKGIDQVLQKATLEMIKNNLMKGYTEKVLCQFNFMWSCRRYFSKGGEKDMGETIHKLRETVSAKVKSNQVVPIETDEEYYYCVGQLAKYLISLSKAKGTTHALLNPIINSRKDEQLKRKLLQLYKKYNYRILNKYQRTEKLLSMVLGYHPDGKVNQEQLILGYACDNVLYEKKEEDNKDDE